MDIAINNGKVVLPHSVISASIGITGEKITTLSKQPIKNAIKTINAEDKIVFPGVIDPHVHLDLKTPKGTSSDDFKTGSLAAAFGGVTTVKTFVHPPSTEKLHDRTNYRISLADKESLIDFSFHINVLDASKQTLEFLEEVKRRKITNSIKVYLTYDMKITDATLMKLFDTGFVIATHAENDTIATFHTEKLLNEGKTDVKYHAKARPAIAEVEAVKRACILAKHTKGKLYLVHLTTKEAVNTIKHYSKQCPHIYGETAPHYLLFTEERYKNDDAALFTMVPPLRTKEDQFGLWKGIRSNILSTIGTDHCPFTKVQKLYDKDNQPFQKIAGGVMGVETLFPVVYTEARKQNISLSSLSQLLSLNAAKIFNLYPKKGAIQIGADADLFIFDPKDKKTVQTQNMHSNTDYSIYEDKKLSGWPTITISRGTILIEDRKIMNEEYGRGKLVKTQH